MQTAKRFTLEISVETLEAAWAAERGGADRIELCDELSAGGITPSSELMSSVRKKVRLPIFAMIRPRGGDFVYSDAEFEQVKHSIKVARDSGMDGIVLGLLKTDRRVDIKRTQELVKIARPLPLTYHRAFDESADLRVALEDVIHTGARRILTSGGAKSAAAGAALLADLVAAGGNRIIVVPGAGINASNIVEIVRQTRAKEFHSGLRSALPYGSGDYRKFRAEVRKLAESMASLP